MKAYRCYLIGHDGKIHISNVIECASDAAALEKAERKLLASGYPAAEVWDKDRRVGSLAAAKQQPEAPLAQTGAS